MKTATASGGLERGWERRGWTLLCWQTSEKMSRLEQNASSFLSCYFVLMCDLYGFPRHVFHVFFLFCFFFVFFFWPKRKRWLYEASPATRVAPFLPNCEMNDHQEMALTWCFSFIHFFFHLVLQSARLK